MDVTVVRAPSSIANLGYGFDSLALAVDYAYDVVAVEPIPERRIVLEIEDPYANRIPRNPDGNVAGVVARQAVRTAGDLDHGLRVVVWKGVPPGLGLGSSGATAAATAYAINIALGLGLGPEELVRLAGTGERVSAGTPHYDNVAASLLGGLVLVHPEAEYAVRIEPPRITLALVVPEGFGKPSTAETRKILPDSIPLHKAYVEASKLALTLLALESGDCLLLEKAMAGVRVVEDARAKLYPYYREVRRILEETGAVGVGLAGAGPTVFAIFCSKPSQQLLEESLAAVGRFHVRIVDVDKLGAVRLTPPGVHGKLPYHSS